MIAKELLLLFVFCGVEFTSAVSEQWEQRSQCRNQTVVCPCKDRRGVSGHVLVVTCSDQNDPKIQVCGGKALYSGECGKVYFSSKRHRRDTGNCNNGIIPGSPHPSDDADPYINMTSGSTIKRDVDGSHRFKCNVYSNFVANVTWLINGILISLDSKLKREKYKFGSCKRSLHVTQISEEDAGNYTCVVTNEKGKSYSATAKLIVKVYFSSKRHRRDTGNCDNGIIPGSPHPSDDADPYINMTSGSTITRDVDDSYTFECKVYSNFSANVTWLINGKPISLDGKNWKYRLTSCSRSLEVKMISKEDEGNYACVVTNEKGKSYSATAKLSVKVPRGPVIEYAKLDGLDTAYIGTTVNITCKIQGFDGVSGYFLKNDIKVKEDDELQKYKYFKPRVIVTPPNYVFHLEIKNVTMEDAGNYTCKASKYGLESTKTFLLEVGPCPAGFYCPPGRRDRIPCPQGTYQPNISQTSEQACKPCPFLTNSSKNPSGIQPNVYEADCPGRSKYYK